MCDKEKGKSLLCFNSIFTLSFNFAYFPVLTEDNIDEIVKIIKNSAPKWREIGRQLGFKKQQLDAVADEKHNSSVDYLENLLGKWLKWAPPCHKSPNQKALADALRSQDVGEYTLANTFGQHDFN